MSEKKPVDIKIEINGSRSRVIVDGEDISDKISRYELSHQGGELPKLLVTFVGFDAVVGGSGFVQTPVIDAYLGKSTTSPAATELVGEQVRN